MHLSLLDEIICFRNEDIASDHLIEIGEKCKRLGVTCDKLLDNRIEPTEQYMVCNNPCGAGISSFCAHSIPHAKNKYCPVDQDCNATGGGKIARCVPVKP